MKIETKFDVNDKVFFMYGNKVQHCRVIRIEVVKETKIYIKYIVSLDEQRLIFLEPSLFLSKEELLETL